MFADRIAQFITDRRGPAGLISVDPCVFGIATAVHLAVSEYPCAVANHCISKHLGRAEDFGVLASHLRRPMNPRNTRDKRPVEDFGIARNFSLEIIDLTIDYSGIAGNPAKT